MCPFLPLPSLEQPAPSVPRTLLTVTTTSSPSWVLFMCAPGLLTTGLQDLVASHCPHATSLGHAERQCGAVGRATGFGASSCELRVLLQQLSTLAAIAKTCSMNVTLCQTMRHELSVPCHAYPSTRCYPVDEMSKLAVSILRARFCNTPVRLHRASPQTSPLLSVSGEYLLVALFL